MYAYLWRVNHVVVILFSYEKGFRCRVLRERTGNLLLGRFQKFLSVLSRCCHLFDRMVFMLRRILCLCCATGGHQWKNSWRGMFSTSPKQLFRLHVYTNQPFSILFVCKRNGNSNWTFMAKPSLKSLWFIPNRDIQQIAMFLQSGLSVLNDIE